MKNKEKYRDEIMKVHTNFCEDFIKPVILKVLGMDCNDVGCEYCWLRQAIWLEEEYEEPKVNWKEVAVDAPILVSDDGVNWIRRYFARYDGEHIHAWDDGATSWTTDNIKSWKYAKLAEEE